MTLRLPAGIGGWYAGLAAESRTPLPGDAGLQVAAIVVTFVAAAYGLGDLWFVLGSILSQVVSIVILVLAAVAALMVGALWGRATLARAGIAVAALYVATALAASRLVDVTYDGQDYHFTAMWALVNGWNPYHNHFSDFVAPGSSEEMWAWHFPKAHWLFGALQTSAGLSYEAAKTETMLLATATAGAAFGTARRFGMAVGRGAILAVLAALNPIAIQESFSRMNDGTMAGLIVCFIGFGSLWTIRGERRAMVVALIVLGVALNTKQSAIVILGFCCGLFCVVVLVRRGWRAAAGTGGVLLATALTALFVVGADPYLRNWLVKGNPVYPMRGAPGIVIDDEFRPPKLARHSDPVRLAMSLAGRTAYAGPDYKLPFAVDTAELAQAGDAEVFLAGFGPWFSGVLATAAIAVLALVRCRPPTTSVASGLTATALVVALSSFAMPESWAVRYVPHLWLMPLLLAAAVDLAVPRMGRVLFVAACVAMLGDAAMVAGSLAVRQGAASAAIAGQTARWRALGGPVSVDVGASPARLALLEDAGLRVMLRNGYDPRCRNTEAMPNAYDYGDDPRRPATICRLAAR